MQLPKASFDSQLAVFSSWSTVKQNMGHGDAGREAEMSPDAQKVKTGEEGLWFPYLL